MEKKNLDWKHIGFAYHTTDYRYVADYKDGKWQEGYMSDSPNIVLNECAGIMQYCQEDATKFTSMPIDATYRYIWKNHICKNIPKVFDGLIDYTGTVEEINNLSVFTD